MSVRILRGDCRELLPTLAAGSVHCVVTSPPYYGLRDYGVAGQLGLEATPDAYLATMVGVFREVRRVLRADGTCWVNMGDSYANAPVGSFNGGGFKDKSAQTGGRDMSGVATSGSMDKAKASGLASKQLLMMPARLALALQADGWWVRSDIIWAKPNPMPESVTDRPTSAHEHVFLLTKASRYFYDAEAIREPHEGPHAMHIQRHLTPEVLRGDSRTLGGRQGLHDFINPAGRNARNVWTIATEAFSAAHFATFPTELAARCIRAGCPEGGTVLDPFAGAGTTLLVADRLQRNAIGIELSADYIALAERRIASDAPLFDTMIPPVRDAEATYDRQRDLFAAAAD